MGLRRGKAIVDWRETVSKVISGVFPGLRSRSRVAGLSEGLQIAEGVIL